MDKHPRTSFRNATIASLVLVAPLVMAGAAPADEPPIESKVATVKAVDTEGRRVWVITGTGYSLRMLEFRVSPECRIEVSGASARLADLERGQVVEVRHRLVEPYEAVSIRARSR